MAPHPSLCGWYQALPGTEVEKAKELEESVGRLVRVKRGEKVDCGCGFHGPPWELNWWPEQSHSIRAWNQRLHVCASLRRYQHSWNGER